MTQTKTTRPTTNFPSLTLLTLPLTLLLLASPPLARPAHANTYCKNRTLDLCRSPDDCVSPLTCLGRHPRSNQVVQCAPTIPTCYCNPLLSDYRTCDRDADCPLGEACVRSDRSGRQLCVGCSTVKDRKARNFTPLKIRSAKQYCARAPKRCGRAEDLCSPSLPCGQGLVCVANLFGSEFDCTSEFTKCKCKSIYTGAGGLPLKCNSRADCSRRELCATDLSKPAGHATCASCAVVNKKSITLVPIGDPKTGSSGSVGRKIRLTKKQRKANKKCRRAASVDPKYPPSGNGFSFDRCYHDVMCVAPRKCVQFRNLLNPKQGFKPCANRLEELCFCHNFRSCTISADCPPAESCVSSPTLNIKTRCVSTNFLDIIPAGDYSVHNYVNPLPGNGTALTGDPCQFDWDCHSHRRCTHASSPNEYGGCAQRPVCHCKPLYRKPCVTDSDCGVSGEVCAKYVNTSVLPFCYSVKAVRAEQSIVKVEDAVNMTAADPTPVPGTGHTQDPCHVNSDCVSPRKCTHVAEGRLGDCRSRLTCTCQLGSNDEEANKCQKSADCVEKEICARFKGAYPRQAYCISKYVFQADLQNEGGSATFEQVGPRTR